MKKFLSVILVAVGVLMPINLWAQEVADEQVYKPYFNFEDNNLVMECGTEGANIYYALEEYSTEDEANIIAESLVVNERNTLYTAPIPITCNVVIKAIAVKQGMANSDVSVLIYNYAAWEELRKAVEYGSNVLDRAQDNPDVDDDLKQQLQWMLDESAHFYRERGMMDSHEAEYFTQRILDVAYEIEEIIGPAQSNPEPYAVLSNNNTVLTFYCDENKDRMNGMSVGPFDNNLTMGWSENLENIQRVVFDSSFADCTSLTSTAYWFDNMINLTEIEGLEFLNVQNVTTMRMMFYGCRYLKILDLSNFVTANVTDMAWMFQDCTELVTIFVGQGWSTSEVSNGSSMFTRCTNLVGGAGTHYDADHTDYIYAHIDEGTANPGYLTDINLGPWTDPEPYAVLSNNNTVLTFYYDRNRSAFRESIDIGPFDWKTDDDNSTYRETGWSEHRESITNVMFDDSFANCTTLTSTAWWFYLCENLTTITGINNLKTDNVTDMCYMFFRCRNLAGLDVSEFKTDNVTDMHCMFGYCSSLTSLDVSRFKTDNVTNMRNMFGYCSNLTSLDVSNFNTSNVTYMDGMFDHCYSLESLDLSNFKTDKVTDMYAMFQNSSMESLDLSSFNTNNVTDMGGMFNNCSNLRTIYVGSDWSTASVGSSDIMFNACTSLVGGAGTYYDADHTDYTYAHIDGGIANPGYLTDINLGPWVDPEPYAVLSDNNTVLTFYYDGGKTNLNGMSVGPFEWLYDEDRPGTSWYEQREIVTKVVFDASFADFRPTSTAYWFKECSSLTSVNGIENLKTDNVTNMRDMFSYCSALTNLDLSGFKTDNVISMAQMFDYCSSLTTLDVSGFKTDKVTDMWGMFRGCSGLKSLDVSGFKTDKVTRMTQMFYDDSSLTSLDVSGFKTDNVTDMNGMFEGCSNLTSLDVSGFKTDNVTNMFDMFNGCSGLTSLNVSGFNTEKVTSFGRMFKRCSGLTSLDVSGFNTTNVTEMYDMFSGCSSLASLNISNFNTSNVTNMGGMFDDCSGLTSLDVSGFNTDKVTSFGGMFFGCSGLTSLDVSGFNTTNVTNMDNMFYGCSSLKFIYAGVEWSTANVTQGTSMFEGCTNLMGGQGTRYDQNHTDYTYAHIDGGTANPGYLTDKNAPRPYAVLSDNNTVLTFYYDTNMEQRNGMGVGPFTNTYINNRSNINSGWDEQRESITNVIFDASFANCTTLTSVAYWFYGFKNLTTITGISNLKTDNVTDMSGMFNGCSSLTSLDVSGFKTDNVTDMNLMFMDCSGLTSLDVSGFKTDNVTNIRGMFWGCSSLTSLDVSGFKTDNVTDISVMFSNCSGLTSLDVSGFKTDNVTEMYNMFSGCSGLTSLDLSGFNTENVTLMTSMFMDCSGLTSLDLSRFKTENVTNIGLMFYGCSSLTTIYAGSEWNIAKVEDGGTLMFFGCTNLVGGAGTHYDENHVDSTYAHIDGGVTNPGYLTDINLGPWIEPEPYAVLSNNNTMLTFYYDSNKERMNGMSVGPFEWIDNNGWYDQRENIKNVVFDESFANCNTLTSTAWWFYSCNNLTSITGISNLKTDNVTNMNRMFAGCSGLRSLDVSGLKTDNVTNMAVMFAGCSGLTSLDLSGFKTDNVTDMGGMFEGCSGLTSLDLSGFKTDNVTNMSALFIRCSGLTNLDLSGFNTAQVADMSGLFYGCSGLISIDLSGFNTANVTDMSGMFYGCSSLAAIQAGDAAIPDSIYAQVANPNLLVYVNEASLAPDDVQNVVVNGVAQKIVLTDVTEGNNNWYCPLAFTAEEISYTREFQQQTEIGISRGWEGIALPFTVQTITHEVQGQIAPFSEQDNDMKKFWLRGYSQNGLYNVSIIEANMPYVISMPNNIVAYPEGYNLNGHVTFAASNTIVPVTPVTASMTITRGDIGMVANFLLTRQSDQVYAINVGQPRDRYAEGSVFTRGLRDVRPFEVYTIHAAINGARPNNIRIGVQTQGNTSGIQLPTVNSQQSTDKWYDLNGHRIPASKTPDSFKKGIYIQNGKKVVK